MPDIPAAQGVKGDEFKFKVSLDNLMRACFRKEKREREDCL